MILDTTRARVTLAEGRFARLQLRTGTRLTAVTGTSWITIDGDSRDIVLDRGEAWTADVGGRAVACALGADGAAELLIDEPASTSGPRHGPRAA